MADAIGSVRATFTASASGMTGAIDQIKGKLGEFAAQTKRTQASTAEYQQIVSGLADQFSRGQITADEYAERVGRIQGKFKNVGEAERMRVATAALAAAQQDAGGAGGVFDAAIGKVSASVRAATPPMEQLAQRLGSLRAAVLAGTVAEDQHAAAIRREITAINGEETAQARAERVFKQSQDTLRKNATATDIYDQEMKQLSEQLEHGYISQSQFNTAAARAKSTLDAANPAAKTIGQTFGSLPGPLGAAARGFDIMSAGLSRSIAAFKSGGLSGGMASFVGDVSSGLSNAFASGGSSLIGIAPQLAILAAAAYGATRAIQAAIAVATDFDNTLRDIQASVGLTAGEMRLVEQTSMAMSRELGIGPKAAAEGIKEMVKGGVDLDTALTSAGKTAVMFSKVAGVGAAEGAVVLAKAMNAFGVSSNMAADAMSAAADASATSVSEIAQAFSQVSAVASTSNQSINDTAAALAILANKGVVGSDAGTSLKTMLQRLKAPTDEAKAALDSVGLSIEDLRDETGKIAPLPQIIGTLEKAFSGVDEVTKDFALKKIFGDDAIRAAEIFRTGGKRSFDEVMDGMRNANTVGQKFGILMGGVTGSVAGIGAAAQRAGIAIAKAITPALGPIMSGIEAIIDAFGLLVAGPAKAFGVIAGAVGVVAQVFLDLVAVAVRVAGIFLSFSPIVVVLQAVYDIVGQIGGGFGGLYSLLNPVLTAFESIASFMNDVIVRSVVAVATIFGNFVSYILEAVGATGVLGGLFDALAAGANVIYAVWKGVGGFVSYVVEQLEYWAGIKKDVADSAGGPEKNAPPKPNFNDAKADQEAMKAAEQRAKTIRDGLLTPYQKIQKEVSELYDLEKKGLLTAEERAAQEKKITDEFIAQTPAGQALKKAQEDQKKAQEEITKEIEKSAKAGADLGAAADPIRAAFQETARALEEQVKSGLIRPDDARKAMAEAVDQMNGELKRLGEDQKFAEKIREGFKTDIDKIKEELAAIDANQTLSAGEKERAKDQIRDKFASGLPGAAEKDAADKFRDDQKKLKDAFDAGLIDKDQFRERQDRIAEELDASVADLKDKQERNNQPDRRAVGAVDVNSSEGASTFFRLLRGQDDPTKKQLDEMKKQTRLLERVAEAEAEVVQI